MAVLSDKCELVSVWQIFDVCSYPESGLYPFYQKSLLLTLTRHSDE